MKIEEQSTNKSSASHQKKKEEEEKRKRGKGELNSCRSQLKIRRATTGRQSTVVIPGPRGYLLGRLTDCDPVKRRAYQLVPSWSATGLWDCSFEDSGIHISGSNISERHPRLRWKDPTCLLNSTILARVSARRKQQNDEPKKI